MWFCCIPVFISFQYFDLPFLKKKECVITPNTF